MITPTIRIPKRLAIKATAEQCSKAQSGALDFLLQGSSPIVRPDQAALALRGDRNHRDYVYRLISEGRLETIGPRSRTRRRVLITRRSLLLVIAEEFEGDSAVSLKLMKAILRDFSVAELEHIARDVQAELARQRA